VDLKWIDSRFSEAKILSVNGTTCKLLVKHPVKIFNKGKEVRVKRNADNTIEF